jgi:hypothetical protein
MTSPNSTRKAASEAMSTGSVSCSRQRRAIAFMGPLALTMDNAPRRTVRTLSVVDET